MLLFASLMSVLAVVYICYHADTYAEHHARHYASTLTREQLGEEILYTHALGGNWQVFYAEWLERGYDEEPLL